MSEIPVVSNGPERSVLIFAPEDHAEVMTLAIALRKKKLRVTQVNQVAQGLSRLCQRPPNELPPDIIIIVDPFLGLNGLIIVKAVRGLPGLSALPIIILGDTQPQLTRCISVTFPREVKRICQLAMTDPDTWIIRNVAISPVSTNADAKPVDVVAAAADGAITTPTIVVLDPKPLQRFDANERETRNKILAISRSNIVRARSEFPRLLTTMDLVTLRQEAHKLTGSSGSIGAMELSHRCAELEQYARQGNVVMVKIAVADVLAASERLTQRLALEYPET